MKTTIKVSIVTAISLVLATIVSCNQNSVQQQSVLSSTNFIQLSDYLFVENQTVCLGDEVTIVFDNLLNNNCGISKLQYSIDGGVNWINIGQETPSGGISSFSFTPSEISTYTFRSSWTRTGNPNQCSGSNTGFIVSNESINVIQCGCDISFIGEAISCNENRSANYYLTLDEDYNYIKIQGGLTNFIGNDAVVEINSSSLNSVQRTPGGSTNRVITIEGAVVACEPVVISISWNSTNLDPIITGTWSVKDENGINLVEEVGGLFCQ